MNISAYILEYLKQFGTAEVPDFGVFSLENSKAVINSENGSILPPSTKIAFHPDFELQSDELAAFIGEQKQITLDAAKSELKVQTDFWKKKLQADHVLEIQNLGIISLDVEEIHFKGNRFEADHPDFYGLEEIRIAEINTTEDLVATAEPDKDYKFSKSVLWIFLFIIPVAGIIYFGYTQKELIFGKKSFDSVSVQTKTKRIEKKEPVKIQADSAQIKISDSLRMDSLQKDSMMKMPQKNVKVPATKKVT